MLSYQSLFKEKHRKLFNRKCSYQKREVVATSLPYLGRMSLQMAGKGEMSPRKEKQRFYPPMFKNKHPKKTTVSDLRT